MAFDAIVSNYEMKSAETGSPWVRTNHVPEDSTKEYYYPLLHTAAVSGNVALVGFLISRGFGDFPVSQLVCSPLMQCMLNIDCVVRKVQERVRVFKEMMELMPLEVCRATIDSSDRPTSILLAACHHAAQDTSDRRYYKDVVNNIIAFLLDKCDVETQKLTFEMQNADGNTIIHELARLDDCAPIIRKLFEICQKIDIVKTVFDVLNHEGKTPLTVAADAGALRQVTFLSPILRPSSPVLRSIGDTVKQKTPVPSVLQEKAECNEDKPQCSSPQLHSETSSVAEQPEVKGPDGPMGVLEDGGTGSATGNGTDAEIEYVQIPVEVEDIDTKGSVSGSSPVVHQVKTEEELFRPLFGKHDIKADAKLKIVEKHVTEKRKLLGDVKTRMEKHIKTIDEIKSKITQTEDDTRKNIEDMKVLFEVVLRTQQQISANESKLKELNMQLVGERKTVAMHEKVSQELVDVLAMMEQLESTLHHRASLL